MTAAFLERRERFPEIPLADKAGTDAARGTPRVSQSGERPRSRLPFDFSIGNGLTHRRNT